jgi:hypothetical protein
MMRLATILAVLSATTSIAWAEDWQIATHRAIDAYLGCAAYFTIVKRCAPSTATANQLKIVAGYASDMSLAAITLGKGIGISEEQLAKKLIDAIGNLAEKTQNECRNLDAVMQERNAFCATLRDDPKKALRLNEK